MKKNFGEKSYLLIKKFQKNFENDFPFLLNSCEKIKILVAVSGGSDSICLLHLLNFLKNKDAKKFNFEIFVAHINHQLRGQESKKDEIFVKDFCDQLKIKFFVKRLKFSNKTGIEETARIKRYEIFKKICFENQINFCFLAHNADDDAETVMMRIIRGTGIYGLSGIPKLRKLTDLNENCAYKNKILKNFKNDIFLIRPLLIFSKLEIEKILFENKISFRFDASNKKNIFTRNKIRNKLFPILEKYNKNFKQNLLNLKIMAMEQKIFLKEYFCKNIFKDASKKFKDDDTIIIDLKKFLYYNRKIMRSAFFDIFRDKANFSHIEKLVCLIEADKKHFCINLKSGFIVEKYFDELFIFENEKYKIEQKSFLDKKIEFLTKLNEFFAEIKHNFYENKFYENESAPEFEVLKKFSDSECFFIQLFSMKDKNVSKLNLKDKNSAFFDFDKIKENFEGLIFRHRKTGDEFLPFGMKNTKKLKDYFVDAKIEKTARDGIILLAADKKIFWISGYRISDEFKITNTTKRCLKLTLKI